MVEYGFLFVVYSLQSKPFHAAPDSKVGAKLAQREFDMMSELEIFANPLSTSLFELISLAAIALYVAIFAHMTRQTPARLPASSIRRAL